MRQRSKEALGRSRQFSPLFEIARVLVRLDHVARCIVNASYRNRTKVLYRNFSKALSKLYIALAGPHLGQRHIAWLHLGGHFSPERWLFSRE
jgi:hypothetical protein